MGKSRNPTTCLGISIFLAFLAVGPAAAEKIIYVDDDATGADDGSSWQDAYNFLQDALADAVSAGAGVIAILSTRLLLLQEHEYLFGDLFHQEFDSY